MSESSEPRWRVDEVSNPEIVWARYADAVGLEELRASFGEHWPPQAVRACEKVYVWRDANLSPAPFDPKDHPAAWLSLFADQLEPTDAYMSRGVWPDQHGRGLGRLMRDFAEGWCRERGLTDLNIFVSASNWRHLSKVMEDPYWTMDCVLFGENPQFGFHHKIDEEPDPLAKAANELLAYEQRRNPEGYLECPYMRALNDALTGSRP